MPTNRTEPRSRKAPAVLPLLHDHASPCAWGGGTSSGNHDRLATSVAMADSGRLAPSRNLFVGPVTHGMAPVNLRSERHPRACANESRTQVALSCLGIVLVLVGCWIAFVVLP